MLAEKIKMLRMSQGLNQTQFAKRLFVTPGAVSQWETGKTAPDTSRLIAIAKEFSVPLDFFSDGAGAKDYTETELIEQQLLIKLGASQPKTSEAKILAKGVDKLPAEDRRQMLEMARVMFKKVFDEEVEDDSELQESGDQSK